MTTVTRTPTADTYASEAYPNKNYGDSSTLTVRTEDININSYVRFAMPFASGEGVSIQSAVLHLFLKGAWAGSATLRAQLLTLAWSESKLTFNNRPTGPDSVTADVAVVDGVSQQEIQINVKPLLDRIADGTLVWHGFILWLVGAGISARYLHSREAADDTLWPSLVITYYPPPTPPIDLWPTGGVAVGNDGPIVGWTSSLVDAAQAKSQVQVSTVSTFGTLVYDSGMVDNTDPQWDLGADSFEATASTLYYWRVKVTDSGGGVSDWSDNASFVYIAKGTVTITAPTATNDSPSPLVQWTFSGTQSAVEVSILEATPTASIERWRYPRTPTAATSVLVPAGVVKKISGDYQVIVRVWDAEDRVDIIGDTSYSEDIADFSLIRGAGQAPTSFTAAQRSGSSPGMDLTWDDPAGGEPDYFALIADGVVVADQLEPSLFASGGAYAMTWWGMVPNDSQVLEIAAEVVSSGEAHLSAVGTELTRATVVRGKWFMRPDTDESVLLRDPESPTWDIGMKRQIFEDTGRRDPQVTSSQVRGYEGSLTGTVMTLADLRVFESFVGMDPSIELRLAMGGINIPVAITAVSETPYSWGEMTVVQVGVVQVGEWTFDSEE